MKKIKSYTSIWSVEKVIYAINDFQLPFPVTFSQMAWFVVSLFVVILFGELPPFNMIDGAFLKYFGVYAADKPSDCHYCYYWTNGRKGCRLGRNNCYYLISLPPKPKSECDGCPYGRDHPCIGWCTKKVMREVGLR